MRREQPRSTGRRSLWAAAPSPVGDGVHSYPERTMKNILQHPTGYIDPIRGKDRLPTFSS
jgi:hypothetical protein